MTQIIFGIVEKISIPELGLFDVDSKMDTGAYSGALHCSDIIETTGRFGRKQSLSFKPFSDSSKVVEVKKYFRTYIRSSTGERVRRYLLDTNIVIKGRTYKIRIGLSDRATMGYRVIVGRRFLSENNIIIDVNINKEFDIDRSRKNG